MRELKNVKYFFGILGFIGFSMLVASFFLYLESSKFISQSVEAEGTITEVIKTTRYKEGSGYAITEYIPIIRFADLKGEIVEFQSSVSSGWASDYTVGDKITILYTQGQNPNKVTIKSFSALWGGTVILGIFGIVLFSIGIVFF